MCCNACVNKCLRKKNVDVYDTVECAGTTIVRNTVNLGYWLIFRVIFGIYVTFICCWSFYDSVLVNDNGLLWFVYITHWGLIFNTTYMISTSLLHIVVYKRISNYTDGKTSVSDVEKYPTIDELNLRHQWNWVLYLLNKNATWSLGVIVLYYTIIWDGDELTVLGVHVHGVSGGLVLLEWFTSTWQLTYKGAIILLVWATIWQIVSIIFYLSGATDDEGNRYIYSVVDWGEDPQEALLYCIGIDVLLVLCHFVLVALKNFIIKCWINRRTEQELEVLTVNKYQKVQRNDTVQV